MASLGVISGLASEADCLNVYPFAERPAVRVSGASAERAAEAAEALALGGCGALMSLGFSGALDPSLGAGHVVIAESVLCPGGRRLSCDTAWRRGLELSLAKVSAVTTGPIMGSDTPVLTVDDKIAWRMAGNALAVDMESHAVAEVARRHDLPFAALRVIADDHYTSIPAWTLNGINVEGEIRAFQIFMGFLVRPWLWPALTALAVANRKALTSLRRTVLIAGPGLQFPG